MMQPAGSAWHKVPCDSPDIVGFPARVQWTRYALPVKFCLTHQSTADGMCGCSISVPKFGLVYLAGLNRLDWIGLYRDIAWIGLIHR